MLVHLIQNFQDNNLSYRGYLSEYKEQLLPLLRQAKQIIEEQQYDLIVPFRDRKNQYLLSNNEKSNSIWLLKEGIAHLFYFQKDNCVTDHFFFPNEFICSYPSLVLNKNSQANIQLLTNCCGWYIDCQKLENVKHYFPVFDELEKKIVACYIDQMEQVETRLRILNAEEHYQYLLENHPEYILQIPLVHIASFLGINAGSLSRIRRKI
ncbi:MAG TPA: hypothetical protein PLB87_03775 [Prolixibacteraceae bacterium]|nr:hypothetical protein [Prolixibacteraceae bacterium]